MKRCNKCGTMVEMQDKFCNSCGGSDFIAINQPSQQNTDYNANQPVHNQNQVQSQYQVQPQYQYVQQPPMPPKQSKKGVIIGFVAAGLIVLAGIGFFAEKYFQSQGYGDGSSSENKPKVTISNPEKSDVEYTKGEFDGSVYVNEWADIKMELPDDFSNADSSLYASTENSVTECGAYFIADDTMSLMYIAYEKLPTSSYTEKLYLDAVLLQLKNVTEVEYTVPDTYTTANIGGYTYVVAECPVKNDYGNFVNTIYVRKLDDYIICISAVGVSADSNADLVGKITTVK